jgi:large conductance mechanosensitive channel
MHMADMENLQKVKATSAGFIQEFSKFAVKGNVFDLAVAVILGNALTGVVNAMVSDVFIPVLSIATGNLQDLSGFKYKLTDQVVISYGHLIQVTLNFLVIALAIFLMFKTVQRIRRRIASKEEANPETKEPTEDQKLLMEIRDALKAHLDAHHNDNV